MAVSTMKKILFIFFSPSIQKIRRLKASSKTRVALYFSHAKKFLNAPLSFAACFKKFKRPGQGLKKMIVNSLDRFKKPCAGKEGNRIAA